MEEEVYLIREIVAIPRLNLLEQTKEGGVKIIWVVHSEKETPLQVTEY